MQSRLGAWPTPVWLGLTLALFVGCQPERAVPVTAPNPMAQTQPTGDTGLDDPPPRSVGSPTGVTIHRRWAGLDEAFRDRPGITLLQDAKTLQALGSVPLNQELANLDWSNRTVAVIALGWQPHAGIRLDPTHAYLRPWSADDPVAPHERDRGEVLVLAYTVTQPSGAAAMVMTSPVAALILDKVHPAGVLGLPTQVSEPAPAP